MQRSLIKQNTRDLSRQIGRNIYDLHSRRRLSLKKLASRAQINRDYLEKMEAGICTMQLYHIVRIVAALDVPPASLLP